MNDVIDSSTPAPRKLWLRVLQMFLLMIAFQFAASVLFFVAVFQLIVKAVNGQANARLRIAGASIGRYLSQIADFGSFHSEEAPFPFADWPTAA